MIMITRRKFINFVLGGGIIGWLGTILYPVISYLKPPALVEANVNSVKAGKLDDLPINSAKIVKFGRKPVILIRTVQDNLRAFSATCTHLACIVQYRQDTRQIWCACHNGIYDLRGLNVSGPPPRPLEPYNVKVINNEIVISVENNNS